MTNYEGWSIGVSVFAVAISCGALLYSIFTNKRKNSNKIFLKLDEYLIRFIDNKLPKVLTSFIQQNNDQITINGYFVQNLDDLMTEIRNKFKDYREFISDRQYIIIKRAIDNFEDAYLELKDLKSHAHVNEYNKALKELKKIINDFVRSH